VLHPPATRTFRLIKLSTGTPFFHLHLLKKLVVLILIVKGVRSAVFNTGTLLHAKSISGFLWEVDNISEKEKKTHTYTRLFVSYAGNCAWNITKLC
jgi:hypothetical protein